MANHLWDEAKKALEKGEININQIVSAMDRVNVIDKMLIKKKRFDLLG